MGIRDVCRGRRGQVVFQPAAHRGAQWERREAGAARRAKEAGFVRTEAGTEWNHQGVVTGKVRSPEGVL